MFKKTFSLILCVMLLALLPASAAVTPTVELAAAAFTTEPMIAAGELHTVALRNDGTVWAWGSNREGVLGNGGSVSSREPAPQQVRNLSEVTAVAANASHTVALRNDGTVWAWGANWDGELGDGTTLRRTRPVQVQNLNNVTAIAAGKNFTIALRNDGTVWAWGSNYEGRLGNGTGGVWEDRSTVPVRVQGLSNMVAVDVSRGHAVALRNDGTVWAWGENCCGQLGDGTAVDRFTPARVQGLSNVTAIAAGAFHTVALRNDGTVWAWGANWDGDGTNVSSYAPVQVQGLSNVTAIASIHNHTVALRNNGTVWTWGWNSEGQLGDGTMTNRNAPVQVQGLSNVTAINTGIVHTVVLRNDGTVWAWGWNAERQLGDNDSDAWPRNITTPVQVIDPNDDSGFFHLLELIPCDDCGEYPSICPAPLEPCDDCGEPDCDGDCGTQPTRTLWDYDSNPNSWAREYLETAYDMGLISERVLQNSVWREGIPRLYIADLAARFIEAQSGMTVADFVASRDPGSLHEILFDDSADPDVLALARLGVILGESSVNWEGVRFNPNGLVDRQSAAVLLGRLVTLFGGEVPEIGEISQVDLPFQDAVPSWARGSVYFLYHQNPRIMSNTSSQLGVYIFSPQMQFQCQMMVIAMVRTGNVVG
ncbi:MAG: hypothetical protein FWE06_03995 [Oscillospiraceae bacterium]|nr:hypothetical protein [Oscillospiraceae bacterium]